MHKIFSFFFFSLLTITSLTQTILSPRIANYEMHVELDPTTHTINGRTVLTWKNTSSNEIDFLLFHMYYNAFKNSQSTFFKESSVPEFLTKNIDEDCSWGWINISRISDAQGNDLTNGLKYVQTDDNNTEDQTVLKIPLKEALKPGDNIILEFDWESKIPRTMPRTGYNKEYYFMAQWFPKIGVYEPKGMRYSTEGNWNCHQYHSNGEYYADFGNYNVFITVPEDFMIASSGEEKSKKTNNGTTTWNFAVNDVIDFTWSASPHFVLSEDSYQNTKIKHYSYAYKADYATRYFEVLNFAMQYLEEHLGPYPYPTISIVDPPVHGVFTGGMEYPTLVSSLSFKFIPEGIKMPETLLVHEFIHQYFMQMIATHEVEEPWMDEGFTTYYEGRILDAFFGENCSTIDLLGIKAGNKEWNRTEFFNTDNISIASNSIKSWEYKHGGYGPISYNKSALWMQTMEGILGTELMDEIMKTYFDRWKFNHPCRTDFIDLVNEKVIDKQSDKFPNGMDWYFDQVLYGTSSCDYAVASINNTLDEGSRGVFNTTDECEKREQTDKRYTNTVILHRLGEIKVPVQIEITMENGEKEYFNWDGKERTFEIKEQHFQKVVSAEIDPKRKIYLDKNFLNNSKTIQSKSTALDNFSIKAFNIVQHLFELSIAII